MVSAVGAGALTERQGYGPGPLKSIWWHVTFLASMTYDMRSKKIPTWAWAFIKFDVVTWASLKFGRGTWAILKFVRASLALIKFDMRYQDPPSIAPGLSDFGFRPDTMSRRPSKHDQRPGIIRGGVPRSSGLQRTRPSIVATDPFIDTTSTTPYHWSCQDNHHFPCTQVPIS